MRFLSRRSCPPPGRIHGRSSRPPSSWVRGLTTSPVQVVDNVFGQDLARKMRDEVVLLAHDEAMHQNATHLVQGKKTELLVSFSKKNSQYLPAPPSQAPFRPPPSALPLPPFPFRPPLPTRSGHRVGAMRTHTLLMSGLMSRALDCTL